VTKHRVTEEPCEGKLSSTVLESSDSLTRAADFNHKCLHIHPEKGKSYRNGKTFNCGHCNWKGDADFNGANVIRLLGLSVNQPRGSYLSCELSKKVEYFHPSLFDWVQGY
jgi:hypothetical protein